MSHEYVQNKETQLSPQEILQAGADLLAHFGVEIDANENPERFLEAMGQLDPRYQGGRELVRWQLEEDQTEWSDDTKSIIMGAAERMRMLEQETPLAGHFDLVIALGGARQSNLDRTMYAVSAAQSGTASFDQLIVAGSTRPLNEAEQENVANYAPGAKTEFDLCDGAVKAVHLEYPDLNISSYPVTGEKAGTPIVIEDVLDFFVSRGEMDHTARIAAVTTQIYQASTELDLARVAKQFGITETFTAGNPSDPKVVEARTPATYLSEVLRTLKAATLAAKEEKETSL